MFFFDELLVYFPQIFHPWTGGTLAMRLTEIRGLRHTLYPQKLKEKNYSHVPINKILDEKEVGKSVGY